MISSIDIIKNVMPVRLSANWQFYGRPIGVDYAMTGTSRFATQVDTGASTIRTSSTTQCSERISSNAKTIRVYSLVPGMIAGCLIDINKDEIAVVDSIERVMLPSGEIQWDLVLDEGVISPYLKNTTITLRAFPAVLRRAVKVGDTSIVVDSPYNLVPGDKFFTVSRPELIPVASPMTMMTAVESQMQIYASVHRWSATTEINHMEIASDSVIYVEANIGYKSTKLQLPDMSGPYIADVFGGKTFGSSKDDITLSVKFFGAENKVSVVKPNEVVVSLPVRAGDLALWSFERGSCSVLSQDAVDIKLDNNGCAG
jgi:hypothetical protein